MNKRYIDFVPAHQVVAKRKEYASSKEVYAAIPKAGAEKRTEVRTRTADTQVKAAAKNSPKSRYVDSGVRFGVIEDLGDLGSNGMVEKRPLNSRSVENNKVTRNSEARIISPKTEQRAFMIPRNPFINQEKVAKRPLSGNVYQKEPIRVKEEDKGPVTIITKPKKDSKVSLVVTIIITIILGAGAGTVAFLLLPK